MKHQKALWYSGLRGAMAFALALQSVHDLPDGNGQAMFTATTAIVVLTEPCWRIYKSWVMVIKAHWVSDANICNFKKMEISNMFAMHAVENVCMCIFLHDWVEVRLGISRRFRNSAKT